VNAPFFISAEDAGAADPRYILLKGDLVHLPLLITYFSSVLRSDRELCCAETVSFPFYAPWLFW
jgi:hypothetical protein